MAGRPILAKFTKHIEAMGGEDYIFDRIAAGETVTAMGKQFNEELGYGSRRLIFSWVQQGGDARMAAYREALRQSADAMVEKGRTAHEDLAADPDPSPSKVSAVRNRGDWYKWEASKRDKETFGDGPSVGQAVADLGSLFLSALQSHGNARAQLEHNEENEMATPRMQRKLAAMAAAKESGEPLSNTELEQVADQPRPPEITVADAEVIEEAEAVEAEIAETVEAVEGSTDELEDLLG